MICNRCGAQNNNATRFCINCGNELTNVGMNGIQNIPMNNQVQEMGTLTLIRPSSFYGCLIPFTVYIDNVKVGSLPNNKQIQLQVPYGQHLLSFKQGLNSGQIYILVSPTQRNLVFECRLHIGFFTCPIVATLVNFYN